MRVCLQCGASAPPESRFCSVCGAQIPVDGGSGNADPLVGRVIGGSYTVQEIIGVGGMGRVYRAEQGTLGRTVAVKVIHPHLLGDEQTVARFYTEARASSRLNHPNSVGVIDFGRTDDGILYLVMEYLKGLDLATVMQREGPLSLVRVLDITMQTLAALGEANALEIVHRDLKPENIIIRRLRTGQDQVKVVDFGLATIVDGPSVATRPGMVCGTPDYMAPEQARGEDVDGRADLYALGVVLFEMLTERLPFTADTPTQILLRHVNDPIPDPRTIAPQRDIPDILAEIVIKSLQKDPDDRYADAAEMHAALQSARDVLEQRKRRVSGVRCPKCAQQNPVGMRYCGACGTRLVSTSGTPTPLRSQRPRSPSFVPVFGSNRALVARDRELAMVDSLISAAAAGVVWLGIDGEMGVGKTRLIAEIVSRAHERGDVVCCAGPHPRGAPVPYYAIRTLVAGLLEVTEVEVTRALGTRVSTFDTLARAGAEELIAPCGLIGSEARSRSGAVAYLIATLVRAAVARTSAERATLAVDDLARCDALSVATLVALHEELEKDSAFIVTAGRAPLQVTKRFHAMQLEGLDSDGVQAFISGESGPAFPMPSNVTKRARVLPLYLENIPALGETASGDEGTPPPRLADVVMARIDRLRVPARRMLQAVCALGTRASLDMLRVIAGGSDMSGLDELTERGLVSVTGLEVEVTHPFIAEIVEASIPAEARRALHRRAHKALQQRNTPIEVLAEHAFRAGDPIVALMLLERMGDLALRRGDPSAGVLAFRRALDLARREALESGDALMDGATLTFSRKLAEAMIASGELPAAEGVLREAFDLAAPDSVDRAKVHWLLARVSVKRARLREAMRQLGLALEIVGDRSPELEARIQYLLARVRAAEGDPRHATTALVRALDLCERWPAPGSLRAEMRVELGTLFGQVGMDEQARTHLARAAIEARTDEAPALAAAAFAAVAMIDGARGNVTDARARLAEAADLAAIAGDASNARAYRAALAA